MTQYHITIISKNKNSIKNFFIFLEQNLPNFNIIKKHFKKKHRRKFLTLLKSPHVNKTAQEQFETRTFLSQITVYSLKSLQLLIFLKKVKIYLFPDVRIKIKFALNNLSTKKIHSKLLNPDNFKLNFLKKNLKANNFKKSKSSDVKIFNSLEQTKHLLKIFDLYGSLLKLCLGSSVGRAKD